MTQFPVLKEMLLEFDDDMFSGVKQVLQDTNVMWGKKGDEDNADIEKARKSAASRLPPALAQDAKEAIESYMASMLPNLSAPADIDRMMRDVNRKNSKAISLALREISNPNKGKIITLGDRLLKKMGDLGIITRLHEKELEMQLKLATPRLKRETTTFVSQNVAQYSKLLMLDAKLGFDDSAALRQLTGLLAETTDGNGITKVDIIDHTIGMLSVIRANCEKAAARVLPPAVDPTPPATP